MQQQLQQQQQQWQQQGQIQGGFNAEGQGRQVSGVVEEAGVPPPGYESLSGVGDVREKKEEVW